MTKKQAMQNLRDLHERLLRERPSYRETNDTIRRNMIAVQRYTPELLRPKSGDRDD